MIIVIEKQTFTNIYLIWIYILADDISMTADGVDCYHLVKAENRYK